MSVIKVNNITNRDGTSGPVIAGIATVSSTSHLVVPTGRTGTRYADDGENIVRNGLVLYLDAKHSYQSKTGIGTTLSGAAASPGSSIDGEPFTWYDMSGYENNGTLRSRDGVQSVGFTTENQGSLLFNGTSGFIDCGNSLSLQLNTATIAVWYRADSSNSGFNGIVAKQNAWAIFVKDNNLSSYSWGTNTETDTGIVVGNNSWNYSVLTFQNIFAADISVNNAVLYNNGTVASNFPLRLNNHEVSVQIGDANADQLFGGRIAQVSIYNRVLTATEVLQNYNALKSRFGL
jgi:hypothetical protein